MTVRHVAELDNELAVTTPDHHLLAHGNPCPLNRWSKYRARRTKANPHGRCGRRPGRRRFLAAALSIALSWVVCDQPRADNAIEAELVYSADAWRNLDGGLRRGSAYLDNLDATLTLDADALWGWRDTTVFLYALYNNGHTLSADRVGDLQVVSNVETGVSAVRLYEAWVDTPFGANGSLRAGLYDLNSEFDVLESANLFLHSAHGIGTDVGQSGRNGPSIFPSTSLAVRLDWDWAGPWRGRIALLDGVPGDPEQPDRTRIDLSSEDGALLIAEAERAHAGSTLLLGAWGYSARFAEWSDDGVAARRSRGNAGVYLRGEAALGESALTAFARVGAARARYNPFDLFLGAGLTWNGPIARRPGDSLGLALAWGEASRAYRNVVPGRDAREVAIELTYRLTLGTRLVLQPDLQYVLNPGLDPASEAAWVVGLRLVATAAP